MNKILTAFAVIFVTFACFDQGATRPFASSSAAEDSRRAESILAEIRQLVVEHYNLAKLDRKVKSQLKDDELLDDERYSEAQAAKMLRDLKVRWGYPVSENEHLRIHPNESYLWTEDPIKFAFDGDAHTDYEKSEIRRGFQLWNDNTCIVFEEGDGEEMLANNEPHIYVIKSSGCWSYVGHVYRPRQELSIGDGCLRVATIAHEAGHALGLSHEQARPDRDQYVEIIWENIQEGKEHNFIIKDDYDPANTTYDISSTMQYHSLGFSIDYDGGKRTIMPIDLYQLPGMGQRARLQFSDIKRINFAYKCIEKACADIELVKPCVNGGYQDPKACAKCRCPPGYEGDDCSQRESAHNITSTCGDDLNLAPCHIHTLKLPTDTYKEDASCTWRIKTDAKSLVFAFESEPDMPCGSADTCYDYVEIRSNLVLKPEGRGRFFCKCGESKGRVVAVEDEEVLVRFSSTTLGERSGAGTSTGFELNVYSTCDSVTASELGMSCSLTRSGYDSCSGVSLPMCDHNATTSY